MDNLPVSKQYRYPPPKSTVPPGEISVKVPADQDVLSGRGGAVNTHQGNLKLRRLVHLFQDEYLSPNTRKMQKKHIAARIVWSIRGSNPPGRFLKLDKESGLWQEIGDLAAFKKVGQALRENSAQVRQHLCWRNSISTTNNNVKMNDGTTGNAVSSVST